MAEFLKFIAFVGFIVTATMLISLNFKVFRMIFKEKTLKYWWLFLFFIIIPILVIVYLFALLFG